jgi:hypothetical protein
MLLTRVRPTERALAVGDEAVHRDAHRVDQHGFRLIAPERRTMIAMKLTIELDIGLSFLLQAALPRRVTDRDTKLIVVAGPSRWELYRDGRSPAPTVTATIRTDSTRSRLREWAAQPAAERGHAPPAV